MDEAQEVGQDSEHEIDEILALAEGGYGDAQCLVGICIELEACGLEKDEAKSAEWFMKAALQPPAPTPVQQERFLLGNVDKTHTFILDGQSLTLQSTNYGQFETFSACFLEGLNIVNDAVKLAFTERVGLRYLDRVMPQSGETIEQYLVEQVQGLNSRLGGRSLYSFTEAMNEIGNIKLLSRVAIQEGPLAFPPDIQPGNMRISERFTSYVGNSAILDNDGFVEGREAFSTKAVAEHLDAIHKVIGSAFKTTATPYAFAAWDK